MRIKFITTILLSFALADTGWQWQNPLPQGNDLNDVWCLDSLTVLSVGNHGTVLRTETGGQFWTVEHVDSLERLYSLWFVDSQTGWFLGTDIRSDATTYIFKTTDSGNEWMQIPVGMAIGIVNSMCFTSESVGYLVGNNGLVFKSSDGGESWLDISIPQTSPNSMYDVHFLSDSLGWAVGIWGLVRKTTDGGQNWYDSIIPNILTLGNVWFVNPDTGWVSGINSTGRGIIHRTIDGGNEWTEQYVTYDENSISDLYFATADSGWGTTSDGRVVYTVNGGIAWNEIQTETMEPLNGIHICQTNYGWTVGEGGVIYYSTTGGSEWSPQYHGTRSSLEDITMLNSNNGWAVGKQGLVMQTTNGGENWDSMVVGGDNYTWNKIITTDETTILLLGKLKDGNNFIAAIAFSNDNGESWDIELYPSLERIVDGEFMNAEIGWILGWQGSGSYLLKTTNSGLEWFEQFSDTNGLYLSAFDFINPDIGWITAGATGEVFKTTNGGTHWDTLLINTPYFGFQDLYFHTEDTGWVVGGAEVFEDEPAGGIGYIWQTYDGGETWFLQDSVNRDAYLTINFADRLHGWVVGYRGFLALTSDGGQDWEHPNTGTQNILNDVIFVSNEEGWIVGDNGTILYTITGGSSNLLSPAYQDKTLPFRIELYRPYPNPFNSRIKIRFSLRYRSHVTLNVYNILGQRINNLVNQFYPKGTFEVSWNGNNEDYDPVASGVYFIRLTVPAANIQRTNKILLLR